MDNSLISNCLFYTFSTTSQTLAALLGLIGTFAIFKISRLNDIIDGCTRYILTNHLDTDLRQFIFKEKYEELLARWRQISGDQLSQTVPAINESIFNRDLFERSLGLASLSLFAFIFLVLPQNSFLKEFRDFD